MKTKSKNTATGKACEGAQEYSRRIPGVSYKATKRGEDDLKQRQQMTAAGEVVLLQSQTTAVRPTGDERETVHQIGSMPRATPSPPSSDGTGVRAVGRQTTQQQAENSARIIGSRRQRDEEVHDEATTGAVEATSEEGEQQQDRSDPDAARGSTASSEAATRPVPTGAEDSALSSGNSASTEDMSATDTGTNLARAASRDVL